MFCPKCGSEVSEGSTFCQSCGERLQPVQPQYQQPQPQYQQPYQQQNPVSPAQSAQASDVLKWGILGLAFSCSFFLSFLGIIFSAIALKRAKAYLAAYGSYSGKAKVGRILAIVGLILGIVLTVYFIIWLLVLVVGLSSVSYYSYY